MKRITNRYQQNERYVNEFTGRHNVREMGTEKQMKTVVEDMVGKRLRYDDLIAA